MHEAAQKEFGELARRLDRAMDQLIQRQMSHFSASDKWSPAINAYRLTDSIEVCVDLAGVDKEQIDVHVEPGRLTISGMRQPPRPREHTPGSAHILAMEIDDGPFQRELVLPREVQIDRVEAEQRNGILCLRLPLKPR